MQSIVSRRQGLGNIFPNQKHAKGLCLVNTSMALTLAVEKAHSYKFCRTIAYTSAVHYISGQRRRRNVAARHCCSLDPDHTMARSQLKIWFVSSNEHKKNEIQQIVAPADIKIIAAPLRIAELQFDKIHDVVHRKALEAFSTIQRPLLVEHTALYISSLNGFPGGQTQHFWDCLGAQKFSEMFGGGEVSAKSVLGYCDGRRIHIFEGTILGEVARTPSTNTDFQWDSIFVPTEPRNYGIPFADLGDEKHEISMRRKALNKFCRHLNRPID